MRGCGGRREVWKDEHTKEGYCGRHQAFHLIICHAWIRTYALVPIFDKGCTVPRNSQRHPARPNAPSNLRRPTAMRFPSAPLIWEPLKRRAVRRASPFLVYHEEIQTCAVVNQCQHFRIGRELTTARGKNTLSEKPNKNLHRSRPVKFCARAVQADRIPQMVMQPQM